MTITELIDKLENPQPGDTFTVEETQTLIDWFVDHAVTDAQRESWDTANQAANQSTLEKAQQTMNRLLSLWDPTPMVPTLEVITDEQSQG